MEKVRLTKMTGEKSHETSLIEGQSIEGNIVGGMWTTKPTIGKPFVINTYKTSLVEEILSANIFRTCSSIYKWEIIKQGK